MTTVYLNGEFLPIENACISVLDRGFLFGDGVYEVIPAYGGRLFRLRHHLNRLQNSLDGIRLDNPLSNTAWQGMLNRLLLKNTPAQGKNTDQSVYLQVTRGTGRKRDHRFPEHTEPTVYAVSQPLPAIASDNIGGIPAITLADSRWLHCNIKAITLLPNVLLRQQAVDQDAEEAILIRNGFATEGSASNLFIVSDNTLTTPPKSPQLLPGITRDLVLELARKHAVTYREADIPAESLGHADEIWVTSSTREIMPVILLDGNPVGTGKPGPHWQQMAEYYRQYKQDIRCGRAE